MPKFVISVSLDSKVSLLAIFRPLSHVNAIVPFHSFLFSPCQFFQQQLHPRMRLGQKYYRSVFWTSLALHCLFTRERNGTIAYRSTFRITYFIVPLFGTERCYLQLSRVNATPERSTFRNGTIWNGTIAFPCERGLRPRNIGLPPICACAECPLRVICHYEKIQQMLPSILFRTSLPPIGYDQYRIPK